MYAISKLALATLVAAVLMSCPVVACAALVPAASHPCCPSENTPDPVGCFVAKCIYLDTHQSFTAQDAANPVFAIPAAAVANIGPSPAAAQEPASRSAFPAQRHRFVLFHQYRN